MRKVEFYSEMNPDIAFIFGFEDEYYEEGKALALEGFQAWCFGEATEHYSDEEAEAIQDAWGYAEASEELLGNAGIPYTTFYDWLDDDGELLPEHETESDDIEFISCYGRTL